MPESTQEHVIERLRQSGVLCCPSCHGRLDLDEQSYPVCQRERKRFGRCLDIPDFRELDDASRVDERDRLDRLTALWTETSFRDAVHRFYEIVGAWRPGFAEYAIKRTLSIQPQKTRYRFGLANAVARSLGIEETSDKDLCLEAGCGMGGVFLCDEYRSPFKILVGMDIDMLSLVIAKKLLVENGINNVVLVCSSLEAMPFQDDAFDFINCSDVLEHVDNRERTVEEILRVQRKSACVSLTTPNRFTLLKEPHTRLWGVGFMPRPLRNKYVWLRKGISYEKHNLLSYRALARLFRAKYGNAFRVLTLCDAVSMPDIALPPHLERFARSYRIIGRVPLLLRAVHFLERFFYPSFQVVAVKP